MLTISKPYPSQWKQRGMQNTFAFVSASVMVTSCSSAYLQPLQLREAPCALWSVTTRRMLKELHRVAFWFLYT